MLKMFPAMKSAWKSHQNSKSDIFYQMCKLSFVSGNTSKNRLTCNSYFFGTFVQIFFSFQISKKQYFLPVLFFFNFLLNIYVHPYTRLKLFLPSIEINLWLLLATLRLCLPKPHLVYSMELHVLDTCAGKITISNLHRCPIIWIVENVNNI